MLILSSAYTAPNQLGSGAVGQTSTYVVKFKLFQTFRNINLIPFYFVQCDGCGQCKKLKVPEETYCLERQLN